MKAPLSEQQRVEYLRERGPLDTVSSLAEALEVSETTVRRLMDKYGIDRRVPRRLRRSHEELMSAYRLMQLGYRTSEHYASIWGFSSWTVRKYIREAVALEEARKGTVSMARRIAIHSLWVIKKRDTQ